MFITCLVIIVVLAYIGYIADTMYHKKRNSMLRRF